MNEKHTVFDVGERGRARAVDAIALALFEVVGQFWNLWFELLRQESDRRVGLGFAFESVPKVRIATLAEEPGGKPSPEGFRDYVFQRQLFPLQAENAALVLPGNVDKKPRR